MMILLVRSADDIDSAVKAAGEFLIYKRRRFKGAHEADEVLGIWLRRDLDVGLPSWLSIDRKTGAGGMVGSAKKDSASKHDTNESGVGIRESFSLSGLWTLCRIDGTLLRKTHSSAERRRVILDTLLSTTSVSQSSSEAGMFSPVFTASDTIEFVKTAMRELQDRYPKLIGGTWFVDDGERGIVSAERTIG